MRTATHEWPLWTTSARVCVTEPALLDEAVARVRVLLGEVDDAANRFRDDSELSRLTAGAARVSPLLADLLRAALEAAAWTDGAVDPTVGSALVDLGYDRDLAEIPASGRMPAVLRPAPGWRSLRLDGDTLTLPPGVRLDLGSSAKAVAADRAAALVHESLGCGVLVSLGGDLATAGPSPVTGWQVLVRDDPADPTATVRLDDGWAVATSSTVQRVWRRRDTVVHHIVDPATGGPADPAWRTVTVAAPTCAEANAASTATVVMGAAGLGWLRGTGLAARLVDRRGRLHLVGGWPEERASA